MAKIDARPKIELTLAFTVTEIEARALDALAGYGDDAFIDAFYKHLGKAYMESHEAGLRTFLKSIREIVPGHLSRVDEARKIFEGQPK